MSNEVRARLIIEGDASAAGKAIDSVTEKANNLNKVVKEFNVQEAADNAARMTQERALLQQELIRRGTIADPKIAAAQQARAGARQSLGLAGLSLSGMGGVAGGYGQGTAVGGALEALGYGGAAKFAGPAGAAIAGAYQLANFKIDYSKATNNEYLSQDQKDRIFAESLPFGKFALNLTSESYRNRERDLARADERTQAMMITRSRDAQLREQGREFLERSSNVGASIEATKSFRFGGVSSFDRSTASGERATQEERMRLGIRNELVKSERELAKATAAVANNMDTQKDLSREEVKLRKDLAKYKAGINSGTDDSKKESMLNFRNASNDLNVNLTRQDEVVNQGIELRKQRATAEARRDNVRDVGTLQTELNILQNRNQVTADSQTRLAAMGVGGRLVGLQALEYIKKNGVEHASPELISQAMNFAPRDTQKILQEAGGNLPQDYLNRAKVAAPIEFGDIGNLKAQQNRENEIFNQIQKNSQDISERLAESENNILIEYEKFLKTILEKTQQMRVELQNGLLLGQIGQ